MKTGIVRDLDKQSRVVLPKEMCRLLDMDNEKGKKKIAVEIYTDGDKFVIKKFTKSCVFCGSEKDLTEFGEKHICAKCKKELSK